MTEILHRDDIMNPSGAQFFPNLFNGIHFRRVRRIEHEFNTPVNDMLEKGNPRVHVLGDAANIVNLKNAISGANYLAAELSR